MVGGPVSLNRVRVLALARGNRSQSPRERTEEERERDREARARRRAGLKPEKPAEAIPPPVVPEGPAQASEPPAAEVAPPPPIPVEEPAEPPPPPIPPPARRDALLEQRRHRLHAHRAGGNGGRLRLTRARVGALIALAAAIVAVWFLLSLFQPFAGTGHRTGYRGDPEGLDREHGRLDPCSRRRGVIGVLLRAARARRGQA